MGKHRELDLIMLRRLAAAFEITQEDVGRDAHMSKNGMTFEVQSYTVKDVGHLCVLRMKAMMGLMKMETCVLSSFCRDVPLFNIDWISAMGQETQMVEFYDTQIQPWPRQMQDSYMNITERDADLVEYTSPQEHWYDTILYPCSYHKVGRRISGRLADAADDYIRIFCEQLADAPDCDPVLKKEKVRAFAGKLVDYGGPAVDQVTELFGRETAARLILRHMYGVDEI